MMRDRAEMLGGQLQLFSATNRGVRVVMTIPYHGHAEATETQKGGQNQDERTTDHIPRARRIVRARTQALATKRHAHSPGRQKTA